MNRIAPVILAPTLVWLAFIVGPGSAGLYTIDEALYLVGAQRFWDSGALHLSNGWLAHRLEALVPPFFARTEQGLAPQYPLGYMIATAPLAGIFGAKGMMVVNAVAAGLALLATWGLARTLFPERDIARLAVLIVAFASFLVDYAVGVWPHAVSLALLTLAAWGVARGVLADRFVPLALAGLAVGFALHARVDAILAAPGFLLWLIAVARRPIVGVLAFALGAAPPALLAAWANLAKFGVFSPISYGSRTANHTAIVDPLYVAVALLAFALAIALRFDRARDLLARFWWVALGLGAALLFLVPPVATLAWQIVRGTWVLAIDLQAFSLADRYIGISETDGFLVFWQIHKKALAQSLPWMALILAALPFLRGRASAERVLFCLLPMAIWIAPFARTEWHGGLSASMRYFLPLLPFLAVLAALGWSTLSARTTRVPIRRQLILTVAILGALTGAVAVYVQFGAPPAAVVQSRAGLWLFAITLLAVAAALLFPRMSGLALFAQSAGRAGFIAAFLFGYAYDLVENQKRRAHAHNIATESMGLPEDALIFVFGLTHHTERLRADQGMIVAWKTPAVGMTAFDVAVAEGRPVFVQGVGRRDELLAERPDLQATPTDYPPAMELFRLEPRR
ncbi:MAG: glycosyltransferase family 39 protein [Pseudomonadota bacterium]